MPPKRKSSTKTGEASNQQKRRKSDENENENQDPSGGPNSNEKEASPEPFEYVIIQRHFFDIENENNDKEEDEQLEEDELDEKFEELTGVENVMKPASEFPGHKWLAMSEAWKLSLRYHQKATFTCPDMFGMYIYNDFCSYGVIECIENVLKSLDEIFKKKQKDEKSLNEMWAISAALGHWIPTEQLGPWMNADDGERVQDICNLIKRAFLNSLNELDKVGLIKADSPIKDLGLVISMYLYWSADHEDYGIEETEDLEARKEIIAYAKKAEIDLGATGVYGIVKKVESLEEEYDGIAPMTGTAKADRWGWKKALTAYGKNYGKSGKIGGEQFNILKMSRKERKEHSFDGKDPLADIPEKELREGNIMLA